jgi:copper(I)-binding protein
VTVRRLAALAAVASLAACGGSSGAGDSEGVSVTEAWARATPPSATTAAVYFDVAADDGDVLIAASVPSDIAASTALHMSMVDASSGEATMHEMGPLDVPPGDAVAFEPGANHVMLTELVEPLVAGDSFELTLEFESAGRQVVTVDVRDE